MFHTYTLNDDKKMVFEGASLFVNDPSSQRLPIIPQSSQTVAQEALELYSVWKDYRTPLGIREDTRIIDAPPESRVASLIEIIEERDEEKKEGEGILVEDPAPISRNIIDTQGPAIEAFPDEESPSTEAASNPLKENKDGYILQINSLISKHQYAIAIQICCEWACDIAVSRFSRKQDQQAASNELWQYRAAILNALFIDKKEGEALRHLKNWLPKAIDDKRNAIDTVVNLFVTYDSYLAAGTCLLWAYKQGVLDSKAATFAYRKVVQQAPLRDSAKLWKVASTQWPEDSSPILKAALEHLTLLPEIELTKNDLSLILDMISHSDDIEDLLAVLGETFSLESLPDLCDTVLRMTQEDRLGEAAGFTCCKHILYRYAKKRGVAPIVPLLERLQQVAHAVWLSEGGALVEDMLGLLSLPLKENEHCARKLMLLYPQPVGSQEDDLDDLWVKNICALFKSSLFSGIVWDSFAHYLARLPVITAIEGFRAMVQSVPSNLPSTVWERIYLSCGMIVKRSKDALDDEAVLWCLTFLVTTIPEGIAVECFLARLWLDSRRVFDTSANSAVFGIERLLIALDESYGSANKKEKELITPVLIELAQLGHAMGIEPINQKSLTAVPSIGGILKDTKDQLTVSLIYNLWFPEDPTSQEKKILLHALLRTGCLDTIVLMADQWPELDLWLSHPRLAFIRVMSEIRYANKKDAIYSGAHNSLSYLHDSSNQKGGKITALVVKALQCKGIENIQEHICKGLYAVCSRLITSIYQGSFENAILYKDHILQAARLLGPREFSSFFIRTSHLLTQHILVNGDGDSCVNNMMTSMLLEISCSWLEHWDTTGKQSKGDIIASWPTICHNINIAYSFPEMLWLPDLSGHARPVKAVAHALLGKIASSFKKNITSCDLQRELTLQFTCYQNFIKTEANTSSFVNIIIDKVNWIIGLKAPVALRIQMLGEAIAYHGEIWRGPYDWMKDQETTEKIQEQYQNLVMALAADLNTFFYSKQVVPIGGHTSRRMVFEDIFTRTQLKLVSSIIQLASPVHLPRTQKMEAILTGLEVLKRFSNALLNHPNLTTPPVPVKAFRIIDESGEPITRMYVWSCGYEMADVLTTLAIKQVVMNLPISSTEDQTVIRVYIMGLIPIISRALEILDSKLKAIGRISDNPDIIPLIDDDLIKKTKTLRVLITMQQEFAAYCRDLLALFGKEDEQAVFAKYIDAYSQVLESSLPAIAKQLPGLC